MMGWRVGFMLADREVCEQATKIQDAMIICAPTISQIAAEAAVTSDWDYARGFHAELKRRRQCVAERLKDLPGLDCGPAAGGVFTFVRVDGCTDSMTLATRLLEDAHVVTIPGAAFGRDGEGCLRVSYGGVSADDFEPALDRLAAYFMK
jgi:aminotransferase